MKNIELILCIFLSLQIIGTHASEKKKFSTIKIENLSLIKNSNDLFIDGDVSVILEETLVNALFKGVSLEFVSEVEVFSPRRFFPDHLYKKKNRAAILTYHGITRRYTVKVNEEEIYFESLTQGLAKCLGLKNWVSFPEEEIIGRKIRVRLGLDIDSLPKPLSLVAVSDPAWKMTTGWVEIDSNYEAN